MTSDLAYEEALSRHLMSLGMVGYIRVERTQPTHDQDFRKAGGLIGSAGVRNGSRRAGAVVRKATKVMTKFVTLFCTVDKLVEAIIITSVFKSSGCQPS